MHNILLNSLPILIVIWIHTTECMENFVVVDQNTACVSAHVVCLTNVVCYTAQRH